MRRNHNEFRSILRDSYMAHDRQQRLYLGGLYDEMWAKDGKQFYEQEIVLMEGEHLGPFCFTIQTWSNLDNPQDTAHTPYCINSLEYGYYITVPKFGELTQDDITKAIHYWLHKELQVFLIFNVYYNGVHIL